MKTLPIDADQEEIKNLVVEWNELLAQEKYEEALELILHDDTQKIDGKTWVWTPQKLEAAVFTYGLPWFTKADIKRLYGADSRVDYKVTSILNRPDKEKWLETIDIYIYDYAISPEMARTWGITGLDYENIIGDVLFGNVPLDGKASDLSALFWIVKVDEKNNTLNFRELHVM